MRALITGITGFAGSHLAEHLLSKGYDVFGMVRLRSKLDNIQGIMGRVRLVEADLRDFHSTKSAFQAVEPDILFHLAAQSFVPTSWKAPHETLTTNIIGTLNLLESVRSLGLDTVMQVAGSSEEYGLIHPHELPVREENPLRPLSPYAVSKVAKEKLAIQYFHSYGIKIVVTRAFNHTGPRRGDPFATSNFAKQLAMIEKGKQEPVIYVGNLDSKRDFTDVRDIVKAYELAVLKCRPGEVYNICTEKARSIKEVLDMLLGFSEKNVKVEKDAARMRPSDIAMLQGDCTKFRKETGWKPEIPFEKTLEDLLDYWRERV